MAKLGEHLFELEPLKIEFTVDPESESRYSLKSFRLSVNSFSEMPKRQLDFLAKYNYSGNNAEKALMDSKESMHIKAREKKANRKIVGSIDKI